MQHFKFFCLFFGGDRAENYQKNHVFFNLKTQRLKIKQKPLRNFLGPYERYIISENQINP